MVHRFPAVTQVAQPVDVDARQRRQRLTGGQRGLDALFDARRGDCGGRVDALPTHARQPDFRPGVGVRLADGEDAVDRVDFAALIAGDDACRDAGGPHQHYVGAGVVLAEAASGREEEVVDRVGAGARRIERVIEGFAVEEAQGGGGNRPRIAAVLRAPRFAERAAPGVALCRQGEGPGQERGGFVTVGVRRARRSEGKARTAAHRLAAQRFETRGKQAVGGAGKRQVERQQPALVVRFERRGVAVDRAVGFEARRGRGVAERCRGAGPGQSVVVFEHRPAPVALKRGRWRAVEAGAKGDGAGTDQGVERARCHAVGEAGHSGVGIAR